MSCLVLAHDAAANPPALGDFQASCAGPGPHVSATGRCASRATGATAAAATRHPPASLDERGKSTLKPGPVLLAEIDLVGYAVQAEQTVSAFWEPSRSSVMITDTLLDMALMAGRSASSCQRNPPRS